jgi:uncharacterized membrane protein YkvA (DUF1232 family)
VTEKIMLLISAMRDKRTPWYAKAIVIFTLAYIISPIDIIPDFIPVLGLLDEVILVPVAINIVFKLIPESVKLEQTSILDETIKRRFQITGVLLTVLIWVALIFLIIFMLEFNLISTAQTLK